MNRRGFLRGAFAAAFPASFRLSARADAAEAGRAASRIRPGDPAWPQAASWEQLGRDVGGRLARVRWPLAECVQAPSSAACADIFRELDNPYYLGDEAGLTQTLGWVDGWTSRPSAYVVSARSTGDVVAAVNFARKNNLRLVVKGGGHSYQGTSNAPDSLLIWTRPMNAVRLEDAFTGVGCAAAGHSPQPAVTVGAGAIWADVYDAVTTRSGRYVQGGGCLTVGVAGLILGGGFGSFSKAYGMAAASLIEAEIVTADGAVRNANACTNPDLFWALKGGGGGSFGVVTRLTLQTHDLPSFFGVVQTTVRAASDAAYRRLIGRMIAFYGESLANPHWGEQIGFRPDNTLAVAMLFQGLDTAQAQAIWRPFLAWLSASPEDFAMLSAPVIMAVPPRHFWDPAMLRTFPGVVLTDDRPGAPAGHVFWASNRGEAGQVLHGYRSAWLPAALLQADQQDRLAEALFAATRHWRVTLHTNKGLANAPAEAIEAARNTAMNPAVLDAFALLISAAGEPPAYPGIPGHEPDVARAREDAEAIGKAMDAVRAVVPDAGSYVSESDFFERDWQRSFWGKNYARLLAVKDRYDPDGLLVVHHGVGSERWSADGFTSRT